MYLSNQIGNQLAILLEKKMIEVFERPEFQEKLLEKSDAEITEMLLKDVKSMVIDSGHNQRSLLRDSIQERMKLWIENNRAKLEEACDQAIEEAASDKNIYQQVAKAYFFSEMSTMASKAVDRAMVRQVKKGKVQKA